MHNLNNKDKNHICPCCGGESLSYKIGSFIRTQAKEIRKLDKQVDVLNVRFPLRRFIDKPRYFSFLIYNPWK